MSDTTPTGDEATEDGGYGHSGDRSPGHPREGGHGHRAPAADDWPRGFGEASWWPFVAALGAGLLYVGIGLFLVGRGDDPLVGPVVGPGVAALGVAVLGAGVAGWIYHAFVESFWSHESLSPGKFWWGIWLFLGTEFATFGAVFFYYFSIRAGPWPPGELPDLVTSLVLANTAILVASSVTLHFADRALSRGNHRRFRRLLAATVVLGVVFLAGQAYEYYEFVVVEGLTLASGTYFSAFYGLTGLHGLHVTGGVLALGIVLARALSGQYSADRHASVTTVTIYWHFVDAVWLFLVTTLYVGSAVTVGDLL